MNTRRIAVTALATILALGLTAPAANASEPPAVEAPARNALAVQVMELPASPMREALAAVYGAGGFAPLWLDETGVSPTGQRVLAVLATAALEGFDGVEALPPTMPRRDGEPDRRAAFDLGISERLVAFAAAAKPDRAADPLFLADVLREAAVSDNPLAAIYTRVSDSAEVLRLRLALHRHLAQQAAGGWTAIPDGPKIEPGGSDARLPAIRARLLAHGDRKPIVGDPADPAYGPDDEYAVRVYQARHGLEPDGIIGRNTLWALNLTPADRVRTLATTLRRMRSAMAGLGDRYLLVNIAAAEMKLVIDGKLVMRDVVVVGDKKNQTPELSSAIDVIHLNPFWHVPSSITREEMLPKIQRDPDYLRRAGYTVFLDGETIDPADIDWSDPEVAALGVRLRQSPGTANALGRIKFLFPNRHSVYLHDTPQRALFKRGYRFLSHGCVRLNSPLEVAQALLANEQGWDRARIDATLDKGTNRALRLSQPMPVRLVYLTAWTEDDGSEHYRADIYERDERILPARGFAKALKAAMAPASLVAPSPETSDKRVASRD